MEFQLAEYFKANWKLMRWLRNKWWKEEANRGLKYSVPVNTTVNSFYSTEWSQDFAPTHPPPPERLHLVGALWVTALVPEWTFLWHLSQQASAHQWPWRPCSCGGSHAHAFPPFSHCRHAELAWGKISQDSRATPHLKRRATTEVAGMSLSINTILFSFSKSNIELDQSSAWWLQVN